ncbi:Cytidine and deoxycytidylate deaminase, partial [Spraguea lophii 42_110]
AIFVDNFGSLEDFKQINLLQYFDKPSWDEYFMRLAEVISRRSSCIRKHVGAVLVSNKIIVSTGYNGTPFGLENCNKLGCKKCARTESLNGIETCICLHAEENAIMSSCKIARDDLHLYTTVFPCRLCIKQSVQRGIKKIIYRRAYKDYEEGITILRNANIDVMHLA